jgi:hypothetical protein
MTQRLWPAVALVVVLVQAVPANHKTPLEIDEQVTHYVAHGQTPGSVWKRAFEQSATPPLSFWLVKTSSEIGVLIGVGSREFWLRAPSLAAYLISVWLVWRVVGREYGPSAGGAASLMLALHSVGIEKMAVQARPYALGLMFALVVLDRLLLLQRDGWCSTDSSLLGIALAGLPWTHYLFAVLWLPAGLQVMFAKEYAMYRGKLLGSMVLAGVFCLPLIPGAMRVQAIGPALAWITEPPSWKPLDALLAPTAFLAGLAAAIALRFAPGWIAPAYRWSPVKRMTMVWFVAWIVLPSAALFGMAKTWNQPSLGQLRYILPALGVMMILIAQLFAVASAGRLVVVAALVYSLAAGHVEAAWKRLRNPIWHDSEWKEAGELLKERAGPNDLVFVQPGLVEANLAPIMFREPGFQEYATSRLSDFYAGRGFDRLVLPMNFPALGDYLGEYARRLEFVKANKGTAWLVVSADTDLGERCQAGFEEWIKARGFALEVVREDKIARVIRCTLVVQDALRPVQ